jgi:hypothetical protein
MITAVPYQEPKPLITRQRGGTIVAPRILFTHYEDKKVEMMQDAKTERLHIQFTMTM